MKTLVCVLCVVTVVSCTPVASKEDVAIGLIDEVKSCVETEDAVSCLKEQALDKVQRIEGVRSLKLFNGVTFLNSSPRKSRSLEPLSNDVDERKKQVTERLWKSTTELLESGDVELSFGNDEEEAESRAIDEVDEGRGKKKKKIKKKKIKMLIPLLLLAKAKAVVLVVLALLIIAASIFKLALLAKIAFIIKIIAIIKALLAKKHQKEETYEIVQGHGWEPHGEHHLEHHVEHDHGWEGGWSRSRKDGSNLAYSAYAN